MLSGFVSKYSEGYGYRYFKPFLIGFGVTSVHLLLLLSTLGLFADGFWESWTKLYVWDSKNYFYLARNGYAEFPSYVERNAFLPGYPAFARLIWMVCKVDFYKSLYIASFLSSVVFWAGFYSILKKLYVDKWLMLLSFVFVLSHPAAFFFIIAYSESLFMAAAIYFLLYACFIERASTKQAIFSCLAAFLMSSVRIIALPMFVLPLLPLYYNSMWKRRDIVIRSVAVGSFVLLFYLTYFYYCEVKLGQWDLYFFREKLTWHQKGVDIFGIFNPRLYDFSVFLTLLKQSKEMNLVPETLNFFNVWFLTIFFLTCFVTDFRRFKVRRKVTAALLARLVLYGFAFITYYVPISVVVHKHDLVSLTRYAIVPTIALVIAGASLLTEKKSNPIVYYLFVGQVIMLSSAFAFWQYLLIVGFARGMGGA